MGDSRDCGDGGAWVKAFVAFWRLIEEEKVESYQLLEDAVVKHFKIKEVIVVEKYFFFKLVLQRFEQYLWDLKDFKMILRVTTAQVQDYALWEVIENGNSWVSVPQTAQENGTSVIKMSVPVTAEEKTNKKNDVKARSLLLMALPNEHQLTFSQYNDAKTMLHKIVSRLSILGVVITQEDLNLKFLRSLPPEWNTHVVVWMNKAKIETMSIDDLYNNFKIIEQSVKKSVGASSGAQNLAFMTAQEHLAFITASLSDVTVYAFLANQPNGSQLVHEDLKQIHEDELEEMDLKWQLALLSIRTKSWDTLLENVEDLGTRTAGTRIKIALDETNDEVASNMALMAFLDSEEVRYLIKVENGLGFASYNAVPPPHTRLFVPPTLNLSNSGLEEFQQPEFEGEPNISKSVSKDVSNEVRKSPDAPLVEELVSDVDKLEKKIVQGHSQKEDQGYVDSGCSRHMTGNMSYLSDFKEFDEGYATFGGGAKGGKITGKGTLKTGKATQSLIFTWVFFLASKDETSGILKSFIIEIENLVDRKVKIIRCDNGTKFKNRVMSEFCGKKGINREFSVARTPQQNSVAERRNRTLIQAARTMLADSKLPTTFWAEVVNTACYVQNRVLVIKPHNKTPYELFRGRTPALSFIRPFGCHVTILNTLDYLAKFDGNSNERFFVGYSLNSKAFRVYNIRTRKVEESLHIRFLEDKPIIAGDGPKWLFDIDVLTKSMNYVPYVAGYKL
ncbi:ribonuclease H-like domain-containing protein [Tanacetum coccineum]